MYKTNCVICGLQKRTVHSTVAGGLCTFSCRSDSPQQLKTQSTINFKRSKDQSKYSLTDSRGYLFKKPLLSHGFCMSGKHASGRGGNQRRLFRLLSSRGIFNFHPAKDMKNTVKCKNE